LGTLGQHSLKLPCPRKAAGRNTTDRGFLTKIVLGLKIFVSELWEGVSNSGKWISSKGKHIQEFEEGFAKYCGCKYICEALKVIKWGR